MVAVLIFITRYIAEYYPHFSAVQSGQFRNNTKPCKSVLLMKHLCRSFPEKFRFIYVLQALLKVA